jgi:hypothetical protein
MMTDDYDNDDIYLSIKYSNKIQKYLSLKNDHGIDVLKTTKQVQIQYTVFALVSWF